MMKKLLIQLIGGLLVLALIADPTTAAALAEKGTVPCPLTLPARYGRITDYYNGSNEARVISTNPPVHLLRGLPMLKRSCSWAGPSPPLSKGGEGGFSSSLMAHRSALVVVIQDLHGHPGVQRNIAEILKFLSKQLRNSPLPWGERGGVRGNLLLPPSPLSSPLKGEEDVSGHLAVFVEGASGPFDVSLLRNVQNPWVKKKAVEHFLNEAKLTGAEIAAIESDTPLHLWGVDDKNLYLKNLEAFYKASIPSPLSSPPVGRGSSKNSPLPWGERVGVRGNLLVSPSPPSSPLKGEEDGQRVWAPHPHPKHPAWQEYYHIAKERDIPLTLNALHHMDLLAEGYRRTFPRLKTPDSGLMTQDSGLGTVALVAGGYHTEGIARILKANQVPYVIVAPVVKDLGNERAYTQRLSTLAEQARQHTVALTLATAITTLLPWIGPEFRASVPAVAQRCAQELAVWIALLYALQLALVQGLGAVPTDHYVAPLGPSPQTPNLWAGELASLPVISRFTDGLPPLSFGALVLLVAAGAVAMWPHGTPPGKSPEEIPSSRSQPQEMASLLRAHYILDEKNKAKAELLAPLIEQSHAAPKGEDTLLVSQSGKVLVETSAFGTRRFFDLNGRWILTVDRYGNRIDELQWDDQNRFVKAWTLNGNRRPLLLEASPEDPHPLVHPGLVQSVKFADTREDVFQFFRGIDFNDVREIPYAAKMVIGSSGSGVASSVFRMMALLAKDQGNTLVYVGNPDISMSPLLLSVHSRQMWLDPSDLLYDSVWEVAQPPQVFTPVSETAPPVPTTSITDWAELTPPRRAFRQDPMHFGWTPDPPERAFHPDGRAFVSVRDGKIERAYYQGPHDKGLFYLAPDFLFSRRIWADETSIQAAPDGLYKLLDGGDPVATLDLYGNVVEKQGEDIPVARPLSVLVNPSYRRNVIQARFPQESLPKAKRERLTRALDLYRELSTRQKLAGLLPAAREEIAVFKGKFMAHYFPDSSVAGINRRLLSPGISPLTIVFALRHEWDHVRAAHEHDVLFNDVQFLRCLAPRERKTILNDLRRLEKPLRHRGRSLQKTANALAGWIRARDSAALTDKILSFLDQRIQTGILPVADVVRDVDQKLQRLSEANLAEAYQALSREHPYRCAVLLATQEVSMTRLLRQWRERESRISLKERVTPLLSSAGHMIGRKEDLLAVHFMIDAHGGVASMRETLQALEAGVSAFARQVLQIFDQSGQEIPREVSEFTQTFLRIPDDIKTLRDDLEEIEKLAAIKEKALESEPMDDEAFTKAHLQLSDVSEWIRMHIHGVFNPLEEALARSRDFVRPPPLEPILERREALLEGLDSAIASACGGPPGRAISRPPPETATSRPAAARLASRRLPATAEDIAEVRRYLQKAPGLPAGNPFQDAEPFSGIEQDPEIGKFYREGRECLETLADLQRQFDALHRPTEAELGALARTAAQKVNRLHDIHRKIASVARARVRTKTFRENFRKASSRVVAAIHTSFLPLGGWVDRMEGGLFTSDDLQQAKALYRLSREAILPVCETLQDLPIEHRWLLDRYIKDLAGAGALASEFERRERRLESFYYALLRGQKDALPFHAKATRWHYDYLRDLLAEMEQAEKIVLSKDLPAIDFAETLRQSRKISKKNRAVYDKAQALGEKLSSRTHDTAANLDVIRWSEAYFEAFDDLKALFQDAALEAWHSLFRSIRPCVESVASSVVSRPGDPGVPAATAQRAEPLFKKLAQMYLMFLQSSAIASLIQKLIADGRQADVALRLDHLFRRIARFYENFIEEQDEEPSVVDLNALLRGTAQMSVVGLGQRVINVLEELESLPRMMLPLDTFQTAVLQNLVKNAVEAMGQTGTLTVRTCLSPREGEVVIEISDTGPGIAPGVDVWGFGESTKAEGRGIGLASARRTVESLGGRIEWHDRYAGHQERPDGATFRVALPIRLTEDWVHGHHPPADVPGGESILSENLQDKVVASQQACRMALFRNVHTLLIEIAARMNALDGIDLGTLPARRARVIQQGSALQRRIRGWSKEYGADQVVARTLENERVFSFQDSGGNIFEPTIPSNIWDALGLENHEKREKLFALILWRDQIAGSAAQLAREAADWAKAFQESWSGDSFPENLGDMADRIQVLQKRAHLLLSKTGPEMEEWIRSEGWTQEPYLSSPEAEPPSQPAMLKAFERLQGTILSTLIGALAGATALILRVWGPLSTGILAAYPDEFLSALLWHMAAGALAGVLAWRLAEIIHERAHKKKAEELGYVDVEIRPENGGFVLYGRQKGETVEPYPIRHPAVAAAGPAMSLEWAKTTAFLAVLVWLLPFLPWFSLLNHSPPTINLLPLVLSFLPAFAAVHFQFSLADGVGFKLRDLDGFLFRSANPVGGLVHDQKSALQLLRRVSFQRFAKNPVHISHHLGRDVQPDNTQMGSERVVAEVGEIPISGDQNSVAFSGQSHDFAVASFRAAELMKGHTGVSDAGQVPTGGPPNAVIKQKVHRRLSGRGTPEFFGKVNFFPSEELIGKSDTSPNVVNGKVGVEFGTNRFSRMAGREKLKDHGDGDAGALYPWLPMKDLSVNGNTVEQRGDVHGDVLSIGKYHIPHGLSRLQNEEPDVVLPPLSTAQVIARGADWFGSEYRGQVFYSPFAESWPFLTFDEQWLRKHAETEEELALIRRVHGWTWWIGMVGGLWVGLRLILPELPLIEDSGLALFSLLVIPICLGVVGTIVTHSAYNAVRPLLNWLLKLRLPVLTRQRDSLSADRVLQILEHARAPMSKGEIARAAGVSRHRIKPTLRELKMQRQVRESRRGGQSVYAAIISPLPKPAAHTPSETEQSVRINKLVRGLEGIAAGFDPILMMRPEIAEGYSEYVSTARNFAIHLEKLFLERLRPINWLQMITDDTRHLMRLCRLWRMADFSAERPLSRAERRKLRRSQHRVEASRRIVAETASSALDVIFEKRHGLDGLDPAKLADETIQIARNPQILLEERIYAAVKAWFQLNLGPEFLLNVFIQESDPQSRGRMIPLIRNFLRRDEGESAETLCGALSRWLARWGQELSGLSAAKLRVAIHGIELLIAISPDKALEAARRLRFAEFFDAVHQQASLTDEQVPELAVQRFLPWIEQDPVSLASLLEDPAQSGLFAEITIALELALETGAVPQEQAATIRSKLDTAYMRYSWDPITPADLATKIRSLKEYPDPLILANMRMAARVKEEWLAGFPPKSAQMVERIAQAFAFTPRPYFLPPFCRHLAYWDRALPIPYRQTISQPHLVAAILLFLDLQPGERVLEAGAGSGWLAALMGFLVGRAGHVDSIERHEFLARWAERNSQSLGRSNVRVIHGDGMEGHPDGAPYNVIVVSAGAREVPPPLVEQLAPGSRLLIPIYSGQNESGQDTYTLKVYTKLGGRLFKLADLSDAGVVTYWVPFVSGLPRKLLEQAPLEDSEPAQLKHVERLEGGIFSAIIGALAGATALILRVWGPLSTGILAAYPDEFFAALFWHIAAGMLAGVLASRLAEIIHERAHKRKAEELGYVDVEVRLEDGGFVLYGRQRGETVQPYPIRHPAVTAAGPAVSLAWAKGSLIPALVVWLLPFAPWFAHLNHTPPAMSLLSLVFAFLPAFAGVHYRFALADRPVEPVQQGGFTSDASDDSPDRARIDQTEATRREHYTQPKFHPWDLLDYLYIRTAARANPKNRTQPTKNFQASNTPLMKPPRIKVPKTIVVAFTNILDKVFRCWSVSMVFDKSLPQTLSRFNEPSGERRPVNGWVIGLIVGALAGAVFGHMAAGALAGVLAWRLAGALVGSCVLAMAHEGIDSSRDETRASPFGFEPPPEAEQTDGLALMGRSSLYHPDPERRLRELRQLVVLAARGSLSESTPSLRHLAAAIAGGTLHLDDVEQAAQEVLHSEKDRRTFLVHLGFQVAGYHEVLLKVSDRLKHHGALAFFHWWGRRGRLWREFWKTDDTAQARQAAEAIVERIQPDTQRNPDYEAIRERLLLIGHSGVGYSGDPGLRANTLTERHRAQERLALLEEAWMSRMAARMTDWDETYRGSVSTFSKRFEGFIKAFQLSPGQAARFLRLLLSMDRGYYHEALNELIRRSSWDGDPTPFHQLAESLWAKEIPESLRTIRPRAKEILGAEEGGEFSDLLEQEVQEPVDALVPFRLPAVSVEWALPRRHSAVDQRIMKSLAFLKWAGFDIRGQQEIYVQAKSLLDEPSPGEKVNESMILSWGLAWVSGFVEPGPFERSFAALESHKACEAAWQALTDLIVLRLASFEQSVRERPLLLEWAPYVALARAMTIVPRHAWHEVFQVYRKQPHWREYQKILDAWRQEWKSGSGKAEAFLSSIGGWRSRGPIEGMLESDNALLAADAARALGNLSDRRALPALNQAAQDAHRPAVQRAAQEALAQINKSASGDGRDAAHFELLRLKDPQRFLWLDWDPKIRAEFASPERLVEAIGQDSERLHFQAIEMPLGEGVFLPLDVDPRLAYRTPQAWRGILTQALTQEYGNEADALAALRRLAAQLNEENKRLSVIVAETYSHMAGTCHPDRIIVLHREAFDDSHRPTAWELASWAHELAVHEIPGKGPEADTVERMVKDILNLFAFAGDEEQAISRGLYKTTAAVQQLKQELRGVPDTQRAELLQQLKGAGRLTARFVMAVNAPLSLMFWFDHFFHVFASDGVAPPDETTQMYLHLIQDQDDSFFVGKKGFELGIGTGLLSISMAQRGATMVGVDTVPSAVDNSWVNLWSMDDGQIHSRVTFIESDVYDQVSEVMEDHEQTFDFLISNNPIVANDPSLERPWSYVGSAGGDFGMIRKALKGLPRILKPAGRAYFLVWDALDLHGQYLTEDRLKGFAPEGWSVRRTPYRQGRFAICEVYRAAAESIEASTVTGAPAQTPVARAVWKLLTGWIPKPWLRRWPHLHEHPIWSILVASPQAVFTALLEGAILLALPIAGVVGLSAFGFGLPSVSALGWTSLAGWAARKWLFVPAHQYVPTWVRTRGIHETPLTSQAVRFSWVLALLYVFAALALTHDAWRLGVVFAVTSVVAHAVHDAFQIPKRGRWFEARPPELQREDYDRLSRDFQKARTNVERMRIVGDFLLRLLRPDLSDQTRAQWLGRIKVTEEVGVVKAMTLRGGLLQMTEYGRNIFLPVFLVILALRAPGMDGHWFHFIWSSFFWGVLGFIFFEWRWVVAVLGLSVAPWWEELDTTIRKSLHDNSLSFQPGVIYIGDVHRVSQPHPNFNEILAAFAHELVHVLEGVVLFPPLFNRLSEAMGTRFGHLVGPDRDAPLMFSDLWTETIRAEGGEAAKTELRKIRREAPWMERLLARSRWWEGEGSRRSWGIGLPSLPRQEGEFLRLLADALDHLPGLAGYRFNGWRFLQLWAVGIATDAAVDIVLRESQSGVRAGGGTGPAQATGVMDQPESPKGEPGGPRAVEDITSTTASARVGKPSWWEALAWWTVYLSGLAVFLGVLGWVNHHTAVWFSHLLMGVATLAVFEVGVRSFAERRSSIPRLFMKALPVIGAGFLLVVLGVYIHELGHQLVRGWFFYPGQGKIMLPGLGWTGEFMPTTRPWDEVSLLARSLGLSPHRAEAIYYAAGGMAGILYALILLVVNWAVGWWRLAKARVFLQRTLSLVALIVAARPPLYMVGDYYGLWTGLDPLQSDWAGFIFWLGAPPVLLLILAVATATLPALILRWRIRYESSQLGTDMDGEDGTRGDAGARRTSYEPSRPRSRQSGDGKLDTSHPKLATAA